MIKQALNAPTIANIMRQFTKDDAIKLLGRSTYNKWVKKLPDDSLADSTFGWRFPHTSEEMRSAKDILRFDESLRLQRARDVSNALMHRYGPGFEANLPRVNERLDTRGRLKGHILKEMPRVNYLREFANRNNLVSRNDLLRWNRSFNAGLDPKTLTSEWYVKPTFQWANGDAAAILSNSEIMPSSRSFYYNGKLIPEDVAYYKAQLVRNMAAVPHTDPIRRQASQLVANELNVPLNDIMMHRSIYNSVSDNTRKVLNYISGRNVLEDPRAKRLIDAANKHGRLDISFGLANEDGNNAAYTSLHNIVEAHPRLTQDIKNHEDSHYRLYNMDAQKHADIAGRVFRGIDAISRKNPEYSKLSSKLIDIPSRAHEAVTDYLRHNLYGTLGSQIGNHKSTGTLYNHLYLTKPVINHIVSETQNLTSNPSLQQALRQLAINSYVPLSDVNNIPDSVLRQANINMILGQTKQKLSVVSKILWNELVKSTPLSRIKGFPTFK